MRGAHAPIGQRLSNEHASCGHLVDTLRIQWAGFDPPAGCAETRAGREPLLCRGSDPCTARMRRCRRALTPALIQFDGALKKCAARATPQKAARRDATSAWARSTKGLRRVMGALPLQATRIYSITNAMVIIAVAQSRAAFRNSTRAAGRIVGPPTGWNRPKVCSAYRWQTNAKSDALFRKTNVNGVRKRNFSRVRRP
jgi:hypothetical protein